MSCKNSGSDHSGVKSRRFKFPNINATIFWFFRKEDTGGRIAALVKQTSEKLRATAESKSKITDIFVALEISAGCNFRSQQEDVSGKKKNQPSAIPYVAAELIAYG